ncbi:hypothetical protein jhhlp_000030 [Lomentospora prolificans]|uniref:rRNA biogenesis protein RRP5 n=1 Tax=Lomentospora prolificans TaxID=41688 RepID=A0A2N3NLG6_9PEZI|nr:hypothetical protein jhhlp_000030 [Lomentospora prolificans]
MSAIKRKSGPGATKSSKENPAKRKKVDTPEKKTFKSTKLTGTKPPTPTTGSASSNTQPAKSSILTTLRDEEPLFPRGGGSLLTPLEQKKIQIQARQDALQEDDELVDASSKPKTKKKDRASRKKEKKSTDDKYDPDAVKVESLSFKKLIKGSLVLGQITAINPLHLLVALPNNLTGTVSITAISDTLTTRLQEQEATSDEENDDPAATQDIDLSSLFHVGQYVRASVISTMDESSSEKKGKSKAKKRIDLSLRPSDTNPELTTDDIVTSASLMASIISVEDHGCVMDIGLEGSDIRGFLPKKEIDESIGERRLQPGNVFLCLVTGRSPNKRVVQLTTVAEKLGSLKALPYDATTINTFLPGTVAEVLITDTTWGGVIGKVLGHLDVTADLLHSGVVTDAVDLDTACKIGTKIKARIICNFATAKNPKLGISLLPHVLNLAQKTLSTEEGSKNPLDALPISSIVEKCVVKKVENDIGLFVDIGLPDYRGFVHISRVKDGKVDALFEHSGPYKIDTEHKGRVLGYNPVDGVFQLSFEQSILEKQYLRLEDVPVGEVVNCTIESLVIGPEGVKGLIVKLADGITGFVTERHLSDVQLQHPEKKFREGMRVKARVLSVDLLERQMRLTLKKTLVNSDAPVIKSFDDVIVGMQVPGTITKVLPNGASVQFYGSLRGFLPRSEMSEAFIRNPEEHFRAGQVVTLHVIDVDPEMNKLIVSCKDPSSFGVEKQTALKNLKLGELVSGKVTEKTEDVILELEGSGLRATLAVGHLSDRSLAKCRSELKRIHVGQTLTGLMVIDKHDRHRAVVLTRKPSLIEAQKSGKLLVDASSAKVGEILAGYVRDILPAGVLVQFGGSTRALLPKTRIPADAQSKEDFGMFRLQSITTKIVSVIPDQGRLVAALSTSEEEEAGNVELDFGSRTKAVISSVRDTQLNVRVAGNQHGRVDMSELFDKWADIKDSKAPLASFNKNDVIEVRVLGTHDARNHRFLPISHRGSSHKVLELTAKPSALKSEPLEATTIDKIEVGAEYIAFVNATGERHIWVNLSPFVRSRLNAIDISDDVSILKDIPGNYPIGSALKVRVLSVNAETGRVDVSASRRMTTSSISWDDVKPNDIITGRVTKANERQVLVQLNSTLAGPIHLPDLADDFSEVNPLSYKKNDLVKVSVVEVDKANKRLRLSTRPSRILNSDAEVVDREILSIDQISNGDIVRGFVKSVTDVGLFVLLGGNISAYVKISNLSDKFLQKWKDEFQVDQLVKGRVIQVDTVSGRVELNLKESAVDENYVPLKTFSDIREGQIHTGKVRKVESYGVFIELDHSANVRGLCHRSEMAEEPISDPSKLYSEGDAVKVYVVLIDQEKKRLSLSLKPSHFDDDDSDVEMEEAGDDDEEDDRESINGDMSEISGDDVMEGLKIEVSDDSDDDDDEDGGADLGETGLGAAASKYDWAADAFGDDNADSENDDNSGAKASETRKQRKKARIEVDKTAALDANGPQNASDYERLLLSQPDSSELWIAYMALQMQVSELAKAREIAERALKTINIREQTEKLNVWIAYLNLEMVYGTKETLDEMFKRACQYNDEQEVYERVISIYIRTGKHKVRHEASTSYSLAPPIINDAIQEAEELFNAMAKKFGSKSPQVWLNYGHFLYVTREDPERGRALLARARQSLDQRHHLNTSVRYAALEWRSPKGDPEKGRTFFEGILAKYPKKGDIWKQLLDLEMSNGTNGEKPDPVIIRDVFERRTKVKGLKPLQAKKWFEKWADWEGQSDPKGRERIMSRAGEWVAAYKARQAAKQQEAEEKEEDEE